MLKYSIEYKFLISKSLCSFLYDLLSEEQANHRKYLFMHNLAYTSLLIPHVQNILIVKLAYYTKV